MSRADSSSSHQMLGPRSDKYLSMGHYNLPMNMSINLLSICQGGIKCHMANTVLDILDRLTDNYKLDRQNT